MGGKRREVGLENEPCNSERVGEGENETEGVEAL